jgi:hypothetical protein
MRITRLETVARETAWLFLKIHTDAGIVGLGEPIVEGRAKTCAAAIEEIAPDLIGKDPPMSFITGSRFTGMPSTGAARFSPARSAALSRRCGTSRASTWAFHL